MRQFVAEGQPDSDGCLVVTGKKFHYLSAVLRLSVGDMVYVRLPDASLQQMTLSRLDAGEKRIVLTIAGERAGAAGTNSALPVLRGPEIPLWLFQFAAKPPKMDLIVRQAAECGVGVVVPVAGSFCQAGCVESARKKAAPDDGRWRRIITEAREQSGSPVQTELSPCVTLAQACALWQKHLAETGATGLAVALYEQCEGSLALHEAVARASAEGRPLAAALMVGAEGGIAPDEIAYIRQHGFVLVHFATNILRCETAAIYGLAALQTALTELEIWQFKK